MFGWASSGNQEALRFGYWGYPDVTVFRGTCTSATTNPNVEMGALDTNRHVFDISNSGIKEDGVSYATGNIGNTAVEHQTLFLFAEHTEWESTGASALNQHAGYGANIKLYSCQIYDDTTLVRNFIPVLDECNTPCLFDLVNNKFYYNQGFGSFLYGNVTGSKTSFTSTARKVNAMHIGVCTPIEYIEGTGTQFIDTEIKSQVGIKLELDYEPEQYGDVWFGSHWNAPNISLLCNGTGTWCYVISGTAYYANSSQPLVQLQRQQITFEILANSQRIAVNGTNRMTTTQAISGVSNYNLFLFGRNSNDIATSTKAKMKLYGAKLYLNNKILRDLIPAQDRNGTACLFDKISGKLFYNQGTGVFNKGTATSGQDVAREVRKVYVGVNGVAKLCYKPTLKYACTLKNLENISNRRGAPIDDYFVLATGYTYATVEALSKNFVKTTADDLSQIRYWSNGAGGTNYVMFGGGYNNGRKADVDCYNFSLVHSVPTSLSYARSTAGAVSIGEYTLFVGGDAGGTTVDAYSNETLARTIPSALQASRKEISAINNSTYAICGGGASTKYVDAYTSDLVRSTLPQLSSSRRVGSAGKINEKVLFCGGGSSSVVDCYDENLTRTTLTSLSAAGDCNCLSFEDELLVLTSGAEICDVYDKNLTKTTKNMLSKGAAYSPQPWGHYGVVVGNDYVSLYKK